MPVKVRVFSIIFVMYITSIRGIRMNDEASPEKTDLQSAGYEMWCQFQPNSFDCGGPDGVSRFYFDLKLEDCKTFEYKLCPKSYNNFKVLSDCYRACKDHAEPKYNDNVTDNVACRLQPVFGNCHDYFPMYYFDIGTQSCRGFAYSGCGGNKNRFVDVKLCQATCVKMIEL